MLERLYWTGGFILACILAYRFHRPVLAALRRFDLRNQKRKIEEVRDRGDQLAHFRHTIHRAEEQVEAVCELMVTDAKTATPVTRYVFEGTQFATRAEAERARAEKVRLLARTFYLELPAALAARREDGRLH